MENAQNTRSISAVERSTKKRKLRGEYVTPQNRCEGHSVLFFILGSLMQKKTPDTPLMFHNKGEADDYV